MFLYEMTAKSVSGDQVSVSSIGSFPTTVSNVEDTARDSNRTTLKQRLGNISSSTLKNSEELMVVRANEDHFYGSISHTSELNRRNKSTKIQFYNHSDITNINHTTDENYPYDIQDVYKDTILSNSRLDYAQGVNAEEILTPQVAAFEEISMPIKRNDKRIGLHPYSRTFVERKKRWNFKKNTLIATADDDGQFYYHPDPYLPAPPSKGAPNAVTRMEYASVRIDSRKYRAQRGYAMATARMDSACCSKCCMRFFLPFNSFKSHISYSLPTSRYLLPVPFFRCPLCQDDTAIVL